jgi:hypothetical protein
MLFHSEWKKACFLGEITLFTSPARMLMDLAMAVETERHTMDKIKQLLADPAPLVMDFRTSFPA